MAPEGLAEAWDNPGLQVGRFDMPVEKIMVCLDVDEPVIESAKAAGCQMVVSHHPLFFAGVGGLTDQTVLGRLVLRIVERGLAVYSTHTNFDKVSGGISDCLAEELQLNDVTVLEPTERLLKLVVFTPKESASRVLAAMGDAGAGAIGLYSHCGFSAAGVGTFRPLEGAKPAVGEVGANNVVDELRVEVQVAETALAAVIDAMLRAHPYEEAAYDVYELKGLNGLNGLGRVGGLATPMTLDDFIVQCAKRLGSSVRAAGADRRVQKVAVCGGSGASMISAALAAGADVLVTGDIKYHDARRAVDEGMAVVDAGHDNTEMVGMRRLAERLSGDLGVEVLVEQTALPVWRSI